MSRPATLSGDEHSPEKEAEISVERKPGILKRVWLKTGLNPVILILMIKGALAPTIALAAYQSDAFANQYSTLGYLVAIMALLSLPIQPRAKFMQSILTSCVFVCTGAAVTLLQIQCVVAARRSSTPSVVDVVGQSGSGQSTAYSAAASATSAVWLFLTIWMANLVRAYRPQLMMSSIQYCIFTVVGSVYAPLFPSMTQGESFVRRLLLTFLTGFAIATGVCLFVFPMTSRKTTKTQMGGLMALMKGILIAHGDYMQSISKNDEPEDDADQQGSKEAQKLHALISQGGLLYGKIRLEMGFARKEIAFGKWQPEDFSSAFKRLRNIFLPVISLSIFLQIIQSAREKNENAKTDPMTASTRDIVRQLEKEEWNEILAMSREPYAQLRKAMAAGIDHICYVLEVTKKPKLKKQDEEQNSGPQPGDKDFTAILVAELKKFHDHRETVIKRWCDSKGIDVPASFTEDGVATTTLDRVSTAAKVQKQNQQQLYLILYVEYLVYSVGQAIVDMATYADSKVEDGTMKKRRLINPGWRRIKKLLWSMFHATDTDNMMSDDNRDCTQVWTGDSLKQKRDPEHLPPVTIYQKITHRLRTIPEILSSPEAAFAFRAAIGTLSIGVVAFLRQTWAFFLRERGIWALIMVAISMGAHSGQGVFGFAARIFGTVVAMVASLVIWYVGYKQPGAIIPVFFIYAMGGVWFLVKNPKYIVVGMISMVTAVLIIGYELQAGKIGIDLASSNGQPYYDIYLLGPYRLAAVCIGLGTAFFWTYFPYPVTTHTTLRKDLGATLYLLANYYSSVHTGVDLKLRLGARANDENSPMATMEKARLRVLQKCVLMIARLREHSRFTKFELTFGGKFPKTQYDDLIDSVSNIFQYLNLVAYSAETFAAEGEESAWLRDFKHFTSEINTTSRDLTSTLCLVAASVSNGQPLPPYLRASRPYDVARRMASVDPEILSVQHVAEPCYAAFAVLEVASSLLAEEVHHIFETVRELVGEIDFSFQVTSTNEREANSAHAADKGKQE